LNAGFDYLFINFTASVKSFAFQILELMPIFFIFKESDYFENVLDDLEIIGFFDITSSF